MSSSNKLTLEKWKADAQLSQQNFSKLLNDRVWDQFSLNDERELIWKKVSFALFGFKETYDDNEKSVVDELVEKCIKYGNKDGHVYLAFIFVFVFDEKTSESLHFPIIRVMKGDGKVAENSYFIDHVGRVYDCWKGFLDECLFDGLWLCVPEKGIYLFQDDEKEVNIQYVDKTNSNKVLRDLDKLSSTSNIVTSLAMITGTMLTFTPLAPVGMSLVAASSIVGAPGAVYSTTRAVSKLVDRGKHDQSLSLMNGEARSCWISTIASLLSFGNTASLGLLAKSASSGRIVSASLRTFCTSLNITTISVNGIGIINSFVEVASKKKEDITAFDILQLTSSIFFFTNSLVNFQTANNLVKDVQKATINEMRNELNNDASRKNFDSILRNTKKSHGNMHGSADFIRGMKSIENKQEFFLAIGADGYGKVKFNRNGLANMRNEPVVYKNEFLNPNSIRFSQENVYKPEYIDDMIAKMKLESWTVDGEVIFINYILI